MSWILGIDTSSVDLGIGLFNNLTAVASYSRFVRNSHAEHIHHAIHMLLSANKVNPSEINHIAVTIGPGSFTGLRIGIAFAKGFCFGKSDALLYPVSSLEVLAYAAQRSDKRIISAIDARNDEVFWASFRCNSRRIERLSEDSICSADHFTKLIEPNDIIITDTMGYLKSTVFNFLETHTGFFPIEQYPIQRGLHCAFCAAHDITDSHLWKNHTDILPHYLRLSSAQTKFKE